MASFFWVTAIGSALIGGINDISLMGCLDKASASWMMDYVKVICPQFQ